VQNRYKILLTTALFFLLSKRSNKMKTSQKGINFISGHEGLKLRAYDDLTKKDIYPGDNVQGTLTIGYGHIKGVYPGQVITEAQALKYLAQDLANAESWVDRNIKIQLTQPQFDALVSHAFNTGGSGNLAKLVNGGNVFFNGRTYTLPQWWQTTYITSKGKYLAGLERRRKEEYKLYTQNIYS